MCGWAQVHGLSIYDEGGMFALRTSRKPRQCFPACQYKELDPRLQGEIRVEIHVSWHEFSNMASDRLIAVFF